MGKNLLQSRTAGGQIHYKWMSYEPPRQIQPGGCREIIALTRITYLIIFPVILALIGALLLLFLIFTLLTIKPVLALIPIGGIVIGLVALAIYEHRKSQREIDEL